MKKRKRKCDNCLSDHRVCDRKYPCKRCQRIGKVCHYDLMRIRDGILKYY